MGIRSIIFKIVLFCLFGSSLQLAAFESILNTYTHQPLPSLTINIPMRDGTLLPTDLFFPDGKEKDLPCILIRTPAGRKHFNQIFAKLAHGGYLVAIQDARNKLDPEGKTMPLLADGWGEKQDGYDTVQWLAESDYTNGKIGTMGFSIMGITQLLMAPTNPPNLYCQYIGAAAGDMYSHATYSGGCLLKDQAEQWASYYAPHPSVLDSITSQREYNHFWEHFDTINAAHKVNSPAVLYTGWYDVFMQGTIDAYVSRQEKGGENARGKQKLFIGPWSHFWPMDMTNGDFSIPEHAKFPPIDLSPLRWFDFHLKGEQNGIDQAAAVTYYVMGPYDDSTDQGHIWKTADHWPIPSQKTPLYLTPGQKLEFSPSKSSSTLKYSYDPQNPVPTIGGNNLFLESGAKDQRLLEQREDVLIFTSEILEEDIEVTGHIIAKIFFTTDRPQTDVAVRLMDVYPDGRSILIADGMCNTRLSTKTVKNRHNSLEVKEIEVNLESTSVIFPKSHQIRISVSSSNYPRFEKNNNLGPKEHTTDPFPIANNKVYFGGSFKSHVILPVIKK